MVTSLVMSIHRQNVGAIIMTSRRSRLKIFGVAVWTSASEKLSKCLQIVEAKAGTDGQRSPNTIHYWQI